MNADPLAKVANAILAHGRFEDAASDYIENLLTWRRELGGFNKIISSQSRANIIRALMFLHFCNDSRNPDNGATFERLADLCLEREGCGPRVLRTVLVVATASGYLRTERGRFDKRLKIYHPTEKLMSRIRQWHGHILACLDLLVEGESLARRLDDDPAFFRSLIATSSRAFVQHGAVVGEHFDDLRPLLSLDGGFATMIAVAGAWLEGQSSPSHQELGNRFRFSASQARKILKLANERDLIRFSADGRVVEASALVDVCKRFIARELALYAKYSLGLENSFLQARPHRVPPRIDWPAAVARHV